MLHARVVSLEITFPKQAEHVVVFQLPPDCADEIRHPAVESILNRQSPSEIRIMGGCGKDSRRRKIKMLLSVE